MTRDPFGFFDAMFCINLDARPERWAAARDEFARLGIADRVERVPAIVHPDAKEGCRLSHIECVRRAARAGADTVLIFEDDVTFPDFSGEGLARALDQLSAVPEWELFFLGGLLVSKPTEVYDDLLRAQLVQCHAYAVHRRAFDTIEAAGCPIDKWYARHLTSYCARPLLAWQRDGVSDLENAWVSRATRAKIAYSQHVPADRRYRMLRWRHRAGESLVRVAARCRVPLRIERGRPRIDVRGLGARGAPAMTRDPFGFFDAMFCINLDTRPERWAAARSEFARLGIADRVERVPAIVHHDGREGCRLSHIECVRRAARAGADTVLIFEDDVTFPDFSSALLARALDQLRAIPDWELFFLGGLVTARPAEFYQNLLRARVEQTHAYGVHRRVFAAIEDAGIPIDVWYADHLKSYCARPLLAWQRDGVSDINSAWVSRSEEARLHYRRFVTSYARHVVLSTRRRVGHFLVRVAARCGLRLRFQNGWPRIDLHRSGDRGRPR